MERDRFEIILDKLREAEPIGQKAHEAVFPSIAKFRSEALAKNPNPRLSAVASIFLPIEDQVNILLIQRQSYDGVHSGQVGFPGGKVEDSDLDLEHTARRETEEEVGISSRKLSLIGSLSEVYIPPSGFLVTPYMFWLDHAPTLSLDPREVRTAFMMPVSKLVRDNIFVEGFVPTGRGQNIQTRYIEHDGKKIWGATAMMLSELQILLGQIETST